MLYSDIMIMSYIDGNIVRQFTGHYSSSDKSSYCPLLIRPKRTELTPEFLLRLEISSDLTGNHNCIDIGMCVVDDGDMNNSENRILI